MLSACENEELVSDDEDIAYGVELVCEGIVLNVEVTGFVETVD